MKNYIVIILIVLVLAGAGAYLLNKKNNDSVMMGDKSGMTQTKTDDVMKEDSKTNARYVEYSKTSLENAKGTRRVLFFYASWCPTCRPADTNFKSNISKIPTDVTLIRVNYNDTDTDQEEKDLAKKYEVTYQHTFIQIDESGSVVTKWNGGQIDDLLSNIK